MNKNLNDKKQIKTCLEMDIHPDWDDNLNKIVSKKDKIK